MKESTSEGRLLRKMTGVTKYDGEPVIGIANKLGTLTVYDDRAEFVRKAGLTPLSTLKVLSNPEKETYLYSECASVSNGTYAGVYVTLVLNLKNGRKVSFCPMLPVTKDMQTVAQLMNLYI